MSITPNVSQKILNSVSKYGLNNSNTSTRRSSTLRALSSSRLAQKKMPSPKLRLNKRQLKDLEDAFKVFDKEGMGKIDAKILKVAFRALGSDMDAFEISNMLEKVNIREDVEPELRKLSLSEFYYLMEMKMMETDSKEDATKSFRLIDLDGTGRITFEALKKVATILEEEITDQELEEMIEQADLRGTDDGTTTIDEFLILMRQSTAS